MNTQTFIETLKKHGLDDIASLYLEHKKPAIKIKLAKNENVLLGDSKFGGNPHLPHDFEWPQNDDGEPLWYLGQFNLSQLPKNDFIDSKGMLYFFYNIVDEPWGFTEDYKQFAVIYSDTDTENLEVTPIPEEAYEDFIEFEERKINFEMIDSLPSFNSSLIDLSTQSESNINILYDLNREYGNSPQHQMFGYPSIVQNDGMEEDAKASIGKYFPEILDSNDKWQLLFQCDSDDEMSFEWGDLGMLYFWIRETDLKSLDFKKSWMFLQCS